MGLTICPNLHRNNEGMVENCFGNSTVQKVSNSSSSRQREIVYLRQSQIQFFSGRREGPNPRTPRQTRAYGARERPPVSPVFVYPLRPPLSNTWLRHWWRIGQLARLGRKFKWLFWWQVYRKLKWATKTAAVASDSAAFETDSERQNASSSKKVEKQLRKTLQAKNRQMSVPELVYGRTALWQICLSYARTLV